MFKSLSLAAAAATLATAAPAFAETYNGPYAGVQAGYNRDEVAGTVNGQTVDSRTNRDAESVGFYAGYNYRFGSNVVVGAEAGMTFTLDDKLRTTSAGNAAVIDPRYAFDVSARAGYLVTPKTLVYARGGYANTRTRLSVTSGAGTAVTNRNLDGWQVGGGVEQAITDHVSARVEYRYSDFGQDAGRYDRHQVLLGVSYNF